MQPGDISINNLIDIDTTATAIGQLIEYHIMVVEGKIVYVDKNGNPINGDAIDGRKGDTSWMNELGNPNAFPAPSQCIPTPLKRPCGTLTYFV
jgi:hypothetical protein